MNELYKMKRIYAQIKKGINISIKTNIEWNKISRDDKENHNHLINDFFMECTV